MIRRAARWLFVDRPTIGLLLAVGVMTIGGFAVFKSREDDRAKDERALDARIVAAARQACFRANRTRDSVRVLIDNEINSARGTDPSLFPNIPVAVFEALVQKRIDALMKVRRHVRNAPCNELYPKVKP